MRDGVRCSRNAAAALLRSTTTKLGINQLTKHESPKLGVPLLQLWVVAAAHLNGEESREVAESCCWPDRALLNCVAGRHLGARAAVIQMKCCFLRGRWVLRSAAATTRTAQQMRRTQKNYVVAHHGF